MTSTPLAVDAGAARTQVPLVLGLVFAATLGQMTLNPIIAPLSRQVGLAEWQVGVTVGAASLMVVLSSQFWGRRSQSWGRKPVLVAAFLLITAAAALFAGIAWLGMTGALTGIALFAAFLIVRGALFGTGLSAILPTAQAYIADVTPDERARVKGMAAVGAVQGIGMIGGAVVGGTLAWFGLLAPLLVVPVLLGGGLVLLAVRLRREPRHELIEHPARVRALDPRIWPFLVAGFGLFTGLGFVQIITGFIIQDRLGVTPEQTGLLTGIGLLDLGAGMLVAQAVIVPRTRWRPGTLLRAGCAVALAGFVLLAIDAGLLPLYLGILLIGLGVGIGIPGYTAGPTLLMRRDELGGMAGLIGATNGLTWVVAPVAGSALYGVWAPLPVLTALAVTAVVLVFVLAHPAFRRARASA